MDDSGFWFHSQTPPQHTCSPSLLNSQMGMVPLDSLPANVNPYCIKDSTIGTFPSFPVSGMQQLKASRLNAPPNWSYCLPHFRQTFVPVLNSLPKEKSPANHPLENLEQKASNINAAPPQKKLLVFDQSGDKTTLIYSSGVEAPVKFAVVSQPNPPATCLVKEGVENARSPLVRSLNEKYVDENCVADLDSEMHEDTEELNALLCSDTDSGSSENGEETSTGHSPSTMTNNGIQDLDEERGEEVASSFGSAKKQKLLDGDYSVPSGNLLNTFRPALEDDAQSSCGNGNVQRSDRSCPRSVNKRSRNERMHETVSILRSIIPGVKGKDTIVVIDEAIKYLRSLKVNAMALGLDAI